MPNSLLARDEIARRGEELYNLQIRPVVEIDSNIGKILSIDVETGHYVVGDDLITTSRQLQAKRRGAAIWTRRIGYDAVYAIGGTRTRNAG